MNKTNEELTPMEALKIIIHQFSVDDFPLLEYTRIIEKELKEYERLKEDIKKCSCWKEHKALEIIKKHFKFRCLGISPHRDPSLDTCYVVTENIKEVPIEKWNFLKEVLEDE